MFPALSSHLKHTYFPLFVSVLNVSVAQVYEVPGKSLASHTASAERAYSLTVKFVSLMVATTSSVIAGHTNTSLVIEIDGLVTSIFIGFAPISYEV